jgi:hypothetical protein
MITIQIFNLNDQIRVNIYIDVVYLFSDENDFSWKTIEKNRNIYYQKQLANQIMTQVNEITSLLSS